MGKDQRVSKTTEKLALIEEAAGDILETFENVSKEALMRLKGKPVSGRNVLAAVNTLTLGRGLDAIEGLMQEERESLQTLSREPAIARVRIRDQHGVKSSIYICRTTDRKSVGRERV